MQPLPDKVLALEKHPKPLHKKLLLQFWGLVGYYSWFIPNYAGIAGPLNDYLGKAKPDTIRWTPQENSCFRKPKKQSVRSSTPPQSGFQLTFLTGNRCFWDRDWSGVEPTEGGPAMPHPFHKQKVVVDRAKLFNGGKRGSNHQMGHGSSSLLSFTQPLCAMGRPRAPQVDREYERP